MDFGLFMMPVHYPGKGLQRTLKEDMDTVVLADQLGFHEAWIGEHHTIPWENLTSPDLFIAQALVKTEQIKLGTGVVLRQIPRCWPIASPCLTTWPKDDSTSASGPVASQPSSSTLTFLKTSVTLELPKPSTLF